MVLVDNKIINTIKIHYVQSISQSIFIYEVIKSQRPSKAGNIMISYL